MKRQVYYRLAQARRWANTPKGERIIVGTLSAMTVVLVFDVAMLICGCVMK